MAHYSINKFIILSLFCLLLTLIAGIYALRSDQIRVTPQARHIQINNSKRIESEISVVNIGNKATLLDANQSQSDYMAASANTYNVQQLSNIGGQIKTVYAIGDRAYIIEGGSLTILDVSNPAKLIRLGQTESLSYSIQNILFADNDNVYATDQAQSLRIIKVSVPSSPYEIGFYNTPGTVFDIFVVAKLAYVADGNAGLRILDISDPALPKEVGSFDTPESAQGIQIVGNLAYVADGNGGLRIIDVSNSANPIQAGFLDTFGFAKNVHIIGSTAYVVLEDTSLRMVDISNSANLRIVGSYQSPGMPSAIYLDKGIAYYVTDTFSGDAGMRLVDISNPAMPNQVGFYTMHGWNSGIYVMNNIAYLTTQYGGLRLVDVSTPSSPTLIDIYNAPVSADKVFVEDNTVYVMDTSNGPTAFGPGGVRILNVENLALPNGIGFVNTKAYSADIFVANKIVYMMDGYSGLEMVSISEAISPTVIGSYGQQDPFAWRSIKVVGNIAYIAGNGLHVVNVGTPAEPQRIGFNSAISNVNDIEVVGTTVYIANGESGLRIVNAATPATPFEIGAYDSSGSADHVQVIGNIAYLADGESGLRIINVSNPSVPSEIGFYDTPDYAHSVYVVGSIAYVADGESGLRVINVTNPNTPYEVGFYDSPGTAKDVYAVNNIIYLADGLSGLAILRYPPCYRLSLYTSGGGTTPTLIPANSTGCNIGEYIAYTSITLVADPSPKWQVSWSGTNNDNTASKNNIVTMPAVDHEIRVNYVPTCFSLRVNHYGSGSDPETQPTYSEGCTPGRYTFAQTITLTASPSIGFTVSNWSGTNDNSSTALQNKITMPANNHNVDVAYTPVCYQLTITHVGNGNNPTSSPANSGNCPTGSYTKDTFVTLTASPFTGNQIGNWLGSDNDASNAISNTLTMPAANHTVTVNYIAKPSGDAYESDGTCQQARLIATDGLFQEHTFHQIGDVDWLTFDAIKDATYLIEVQMPSDSPVNVVMDTSKDCSASTLGPTWDNPYTRGVRMSIHSTISGRLYIRLNNRDSTVAGPQIRYRVAVTRNESTAAVGALIIVAGRYEFDDPLQPQIFHVANDVYDFFAEQGYTDEHIYYLTADDFQIASHLQSSRYDAPATLQNLGFAITEWAKARVDDKRMLTLYLVDHGDTDIFYLDQINNQGLTPTQLDKWLTALESVTPGLKINIIIEACKSGSFIKTIGNPNRLVITSTSADKNAITSDIGAHFSDQFLASLRQGSTLYSSFQLARENARIFLDDQDAWLDANGNGIPNEQEDEVIAAQVGLLTSYTPTNELWPPQINTLQLTSEISGTRATIRTTVSDDGTVSGVWVVIIPPSAATPPETANQLIPDNALPMTTVNSVLGQYQLDYNDFSEAGTYRIVVYAEDDDGLTSQPFAITVESEGVVGENVFLPLVMR